MRIGLIALLVLPLTIGCDIDCEETCDLDYQDCVEAGSPHTVCKSRLNKCQSECEEEDRAWDDESEEGCDFDSVSAEAAIASGRVPIWLFLFMGFIRRIRRLR
jgi:hypothetical protein